MDTPRKISVGCSGRPISLLPGPLVEPAEPTANQFNNAQPAAVYPVTIKLCG